MCRCVYGDLRYSLAPDCQDTFPAELQHLQAGRLKNTVNRKFQALTKDKERLGYDAIVGWPLPLSKPVELRLVAGLIQDSIVEQNAESECILKRDFLAVSH